MTYRKAASVGVVRSKQRNHSGRANEKYTLVQSSIRAVVCVARSTQSNFNARRAASPALAGVQ